MRNVLLYAFLLFLTLGCQSAHEDFQRAETSTAPADGIAFEREEADAPVANADEKTAAPTPAAPAAVPSGKQFVRTTDARFKVKEVTKATTAIENSLARHGGYVSSSSISSQVLHTRTVEVSPDSSLVLTQYQPEGTMLLRVPSQRLDSLVRDLAPHVLFLDHRTHQAEEVSLQLYRQLLAQKRHEEFVSRLSQTIDKKQARLPDAATAEEARLQKQQQADDALLAQLALNDRISYSTLTVRLYESPKLRRELVVNPNAVHHVRPYEPGFGTKLLAAAAEGWQVFEYLLLLLVRFWGVLLLVGGALALYQWLRRRQAQA